MDEQDRAERRAEVHDAANAKRLLDDPMLAAVWDAQEASILSHWVHSQPTQSDLREALWQKLDAHRQARRDLMRAIETGDLAAEQLQTEADK